MEGSNARAVAALLLSLGLILGVSSGLAQTATSSLYGEVTDPQGAAVVGAKVTVTNLGTDVVRTDTTDSSGRFNFTSLAPGRYKLQVEMPGFRTAVRDNLELLVNTAVRANIQLELGAVTETVTVEAGVQVLNTTDATIGNAFSESQIKQLPLEGRNVVGLLSLQPGAVYLPTGDQRSGSISGSRADQANVTLDGVDVNDPQFNTAYTAVLRSTLDSVQEFRVTTTNYGADQGRSSSAQVSLVTKSGTNEVHGTAYWYHRNTATSSNEYFLKLAQAAAGEPNKPPRLQKHIFGASGGGPIVKDRFFIFANFESLRDNRESVVERSVPSLTLRDGIMVYQCTTNPGPDGILGTADDVPCPTTSTSVTGLSGSSYTIPAGFYGLSPAQMAAIDPLGIGPSVPASQYFRLYPAPNGAGRDGVNIMAYRFAAPVNNVFWTWIARADYKIDPQGNHSVFFRGNLQDDVLGGVPQFPGQPPSTQQLVNNKGFAIGYTAVLSPHAVNNFRYGYTRVSEATAGLRNSNWVFFRFISSYYAQTSSNARFPLTNNWVDDFSYTWKSHTFQVGTNIRRTRNYRFSNANSFHDAVANGSWVSGVGTTYMPGNPCPPPSDVGCNAVPAVDPSFTASYADALIDLLGIISEVDAIYNYDRTGAVIPTGTPIRRNYGSDEYEVYGQDTWRIRSNLTVTFGVRYGIYSPPFEVNGMQVAPSVSLGEWFEERGRNAARGIPSNAIPPFTVDLAGPANGRRGFYDWDKNNFAPRVSFAYTPLFQSGPLGWLTGNGKMVIRGGYSLVYDRIGQALATQYDNVGSFGLSTQLSSPFGVNNEDNPAIRFVDLTTMPPTLPAAPPGGFPQTPPSGAGAISSSLDDSIITPYAHLFNLVVGREFPWDMTMEVAYVGRRGRNLLIRRDLANPVNLVDPASGMDYFTAARLAIAAAAGIPKNAPASAYAGIPSIPYWENLFPTAGASGGRGLTNTQEIVRRFNRDGPDYMTSLWLMDQFCTPDCSRFGPYAYFNDQFDALAAQSSKGRSEYHGMQLTVRKRRSHGLQFDFNYTLAKSLDLGSAIEQGSFYTEFFSGGYTGFLINPWMPELHYAQSDFDVRHQINVNWIYELPYGKGQPFGSNAPGWAENILGGWQVSGLLRWTSGFPFNVINCRSCWTTNWNLQSNAELVTPGVLPEQKTTKNAVGGYPSPFADPASAINYFRRALPGEVGLRNVLRGDGYFTIDLGVSKSWSMPWKESHKLKFRWETFNLTNSVRFDTGNVTMFPDIASSFGRYDGSLATCDGAAGRCMQFAFRYEF
jgi:hypothetical protein